MVFGLKGASSSCWTLSNRDSIGFDLKKKHLSLLFSWKSQSQTYKKVADQIFKKNELNHVDLAKPLLWLVQVEVSPELKTSKLETFIPDHLIWISTMDTYDFWLVNYFSLFLDIHTLLWPMRVL